MTEYLQIVDENNEPTGTASRDEVQQNGLIARVAHVIVTDTQGRLLCQKRAASAKAWPGCYTSTGSGHVDTDETNEHAAVRELSEEAGIQLSENNLEYLDTSYLEHRHGDVLNKRFHIVFHAVVDPTIRMDAQLSEVSELRWFTPAEIVDMLASNPLQFTPTFQHYFDMYFAPQS